ncbi:MAG: hypothetical protein NTZ79_16995 [Proteobacteria bacterium]|nr:hypothetical protein [Pseudomonadota bacterium]
MKLSNIRSPDSFILPTTKAKSIALVDPAVQTRKPYLRSLQPTARI